MQPGLVAKYAGAPLCARLRPVVLGSVSTAALVFGLGATDLLAQSLGDRTTPYVRHEIGHDGRNGDVNENAARGDNGVSFNVFFNGALGNGRATTAPMIDLRSEAGEGGNAYGNAILYNGRAGTGGKAGDVDFFSLGVVNIGASPQSKGTPLFSIVSIGGRGGAPATYGVGGYEYGGYGGAGGNVGFDGNAPIALTGDRFAIVRATSQGGDGRGGLHGGASGHVGIDIHRNAVLSTNGSSAPAIIGEALGGHGGDSEHGHYRSIDGGLGGAGAGLTTDLGVRSGPNKVGVRLINDGEIKTSGALSTAVLLQNIGGNGADGKGGGDGGAGGNAGSIAAVQRGSIATEGAYSFGIVAQSVGGSGGQGGRGFFIGPPGGNAGRGGAVLINNMGAVTTKGEGATALVAQSVGGGAALDAFQSQAILPKGVKPKDGAGGLDVTAAPGGGAGGNTTGLFFAKGGPGGTGGDGGHVTVLNRGVLSTAGEAAYGILAQSVGGSGGVGGDSLAAGGFLSVAIGGKGGGGGHGGVVDIGSLAAANSFTGDKAAAVRQATSRLSPTLSEDGRKKANSQAAIDFGKSYASITTTGNNATGVIAQSVGGGGGSGGSAISASAGFLVSVSVAIGGSGGKGGNGGDINIWNTSAITTDGSGSKGILAQSIGGGGGSGGSARSYAVAVGTGPFPAVAASIAIGGSGGDGGNGGAVTVRNFNGIVTSGKSAPGIDALSIGGGGGAGGNAFSYALALQTAAMPSVDFNVSVGGSGGKGGSGGAITVVNNDRILTQGVASNGINVMSVGGGGGKGGDAASLAGLMSFYLNVAVPITIGGSGGEGGAGKNVTVDNKGLIETLDQFSNAIDISSIGGGGGNGGIADSTAETGAGYSGYGSDSLNTAVGLLPIAKAITADIKVGGSGGSGGKGGDVTVTNGGALLTHGSNSSGIVAYSIGGGGGSGGGFQGGGKGKIAGNLRIGGSGGLGGEGGEVTLTNSAGASISTVEDGSHGVFAQSIGGGGGNGGTFTGKRKSAAITAIGTEKQNWLAVGNKLVGELGKVNDIGKLVFAEKKLDKLPGETDAALKTRQATYDSQRVFRDKNFDKGSTLQNRMDQVKRIGIVLKAVQSVKDRQDKIDKLEKDRTGKAGAALAAVDAEIASLRAAQINDGLDGSLNLALNVFKEKIKDALKAADVGLVAKNAKRGGSLKAWEDDYPSASLNVSVGGSGGLGGKGGKVTVTNAGDITTHGEISYGVFAQSVGGGGGAGGAAFASGDNQVNANISVGRDGASGGDGGRVEVTNSGKIITQGAASFGLLAQSVGGGGGLGGASSAENGISASINANVGGNGGASGAGGAVAVTNSGGITTAGRDAHALVAQSVGGGGGVFFNNMKSPRELELDRQKAEKDRQAKAASTLSVEEQAYATEVDEAIGLIQRFVNWVGGIEPQQAGDAGIDRWATILPTPSINVNIGGNGRAGGNGGAVTVTHSGAITTHGEAAFGIFAQSIGGGGGFGSNATHGGLLSGNWSVGGRGGAAGNGGDIDITLGRAASITTTGDGAHAILAQSIGGGGGYGGTARNMLFPDYIKDGGSSGNGGGVKILSADGAQPSTLAITTTGAKAHGIFAQSLGGGGGLMASLVGPEVEKSATAGRTQAKGDGALVTINTVGKISATGANSYGIFAQSGVQKADGSIDGGKGGSIVAITHTGAITGGSGKGAAIRSDSPWVSSIRIGAGSVIQAQSGTAIVTPLGNTRLFNSGTIIGNIRMNSGEFQNLAGGTYQSAPGGEVDLGVRLRDINLTFSNAGVFNIGGSNVITTTDVKGTFTQQSGGSLAIDISPAFGAPGPNSDLLRVSGRATFQGASYVQPNALTFLLPGTYTFLDAPNGIFGKPEVTGVKEVAVPITWTVDSRNIRNIGGFTVPTQLSLSPHADFTKPRGTTLTGDQQGVANSVQAAWNAASVAQGAVFPRLLGIVSPQAYAKSLDEMSAQETEAANAMSALGVRTSLRAPLSCPAFSGAGVMLRENDCLWGQIQGGAANMGTNHAEYGYSTNTLSYRVGGQKEVQPNWFLGFSAAYSQGSTTHRDQIAGGNSDTYEGAIAIKRQIGAWTFAASATVGNTWYRSTRLLSIGDASSIALSRPESFFTGLRLRGAYEFAFTNWYVKPYLDVDALYVRSPAYSEWGSPGMNLDVQKTSKGLFAISPNIEVGGRIDLENGFWIRPYGTVGVTLLSSGESASLASLQGAPASVGAFRTTSRLPDRLFDAGFGLQIAAGNGMELTAEYQASVANAFISHRGSAKFVVKF